MDVFNKIKRSEIMRAVKSKKNKSTELKLIELLKANKITGWRRNYNIFGKPDFVFIKYKLAIFVDGCFWHGHSCRNTSPSSNIEYWHNKIKRNIKRDKIVNKHLKDIDWKTIRIWECEIKNNPQKIVNKINKALS